MAPTVRALATHVRLLDLGRAKWHDSAAQAQAADEAGVEDLLRSWLAEAAELA